MSMFVYITEARRWLVSVGSDTSADLGLSNNILKLAHLSLEELSSYEQCVECSCVDTQH